MLSHSSQLKREVILFHFFLSFFSQLVTIVWISLVRELYHVQITPYPPEKSCCEVSSTQVLKSSMCMFFSSSIAVLLFGTRATAAWHGIQSITSRVSAAVQVLLFLPGTWARTYKAYVPCGNIKAWCSLGNAQFSSCRLQSFYEHTISIQRLEYPWGAL